jgi:hypothetical protein
LEKERLTLTKWERHCLKVLFNRSITFGDLIDHFGRIVWLSIDLLGRSGVGGAIVWLSGVDEINRLD